MNWVFSIVTVATVHAKVGRNFAVGSCVPLNSADLFQIKTENWKLVWRIITARQSLASIETIWIAWTINWPGFRSGEKIGCYECLLAGCLPIKLKSWEACCLKHTLIEAKTLQQMSLIGFLDLFLSPLVGFVSPTSLTHWINSTSWMMLPPVSSGLDALQYWVLAAADFRTLVILPSAKRKESSATPLPTEIPKARLSIPKKRNRGPPVHEFIFSYRPAWFSRSRSRGEK